MILRDVLGTVIVPGASIVYARNGGRAESLRVATVLRIEPRRIRRRRVGTLLLPCVVARRVDGVTVVLRDPLRVVVINGAAPADFSLPGPTPTTRRVR